MQWWWWFRHQTARLIRRLQTPKWQIVLAVSPDREGLSSRAWPAHLARLPQGQGDLGDRMARALRSFPGPTLVIGGDIPGIKPKHIDAAFKALGDHDAVFGPAQDGGYWLVGLKNTTPPPSKLFQNVRWSTSHALTDTLKTLPGKRIAFVDTLRDIDTGADMAKTTRACDPAND